MEQSFFFRVIYTDLNDKRVREFFLDNKSDAMDQSDALKKDHTIASFIVLNCSIHEKFDRFDSNNNLKLK